ncbi:ABC transporter permease [Listeria booriae]|uniref:ABC transporter permease n=1 Tax=Listeria booriae TaxID=1552123 RepID=UPI00162ABBA5|nr:ABC transporter permease [Listeria booriae]MBC2080827.1 ABC transporter permease [Listeria booriae]
MNNFLIMARYQIKLLFRNYKSLILGFSLPIIMFFIFGNLLSNYQVYGDINLTSLLVPAYIPIIIINGVLVIYGQNFLVYKEQGNLIKYKLLGLRQITISTSMYFATLVFQILAVFVLIIFAYFTKGVEFPFNQSISLIGTFVLINILEYSIVFLLTSLVNKSVTYQSISLMIFYFQIFLGGLTFPPEMFPKFLKEIVYIFNPIIYGLEMMRDMWIGNKSFFDEGKNISILLLWSLFFFGLGFFFNKSNLNKNRDSKFVNVKQNT